MFTRRNWLLRCSILINIAVALYICSHVMIGSGGNFATGPAFIIQDDVPKLRTLSSSSSSSVPQISGKDRNDLRIQEQEAQNPSNPDSEAGPPVQDSKEQQSSVKDKATEEGAISPNNNQISSDDPVNQQAQAQFLPENHDIENQQKEILESGGGPDGKNFEVLPSEPNFTVQEKGPPNEAPIQSEVIVSFVNSSNAYGGGAYVASGDLIEFDERLKSIMKCHDREYKPETLQRGDFWVLKNYVRAEHGELKCHETVTYTTHADYTFLDNLVPLLERWMAPISIGLHAPGNDFQPTINSIKYLRDCLNESQLVRQFVTFHIYFSTKHIPKSVPKWDKVLQPPYNCSLPIPYSNISIGQLYKTQKKLLYPVNVGRNIARDSAQTNFILASDIELYPNPGLVKKFLEMIARNDAALQRKNPRVFPLSIFEVESASPVPKDKTELQELLRTNKAIPFHKRVCSSCHGVPKSKEWMAANETEELGVFHIGKRVGYFIHWEPIYIGTHADPHYDERLSWEGKSDKMTQGYALCALDYDFHILDNAFLVHKPGIKILKKDPRRAMLAAKTNQLIKKIIYPELRIMYGIRKGCAV